MNCQQRARRWFGDTNRSLVLTNSTKRPWWAASASAVSHAFCRWTSSARRSIAARASGNAVAMSRWKSACLRRADGRGPAGAFSSTGAWCTGAVMMTGSPTGTGTPSPAGGTSGTAPRANSGRTGLVRASKACWVARLRFVWRGTLLPWRALLNALHLSTVETASNGAKSMMLAR